MVWVASAAHGCRSRGKGGAREDGTVREALIQVVAQVQRGYRGCDFPPSLSPDILILQDRIM